MAHLIRNFLKLSASERTRNLNMAKTVLISKTNEQLKEYRITKRDGKAGKCMAAA